MNIDSGPTEVGEAAERRRAVRARRAQLFRRVYLAVLLTALPGTAGVLWVLSRIRHEGDNLDIHGLIAVSTGIIGVLVFYIFLYKYQTTSPMRARRRAFLLAGHALTIALLFWLLIWLGFDSPWRDVSCWGNYEFNTAARSWIMSVLVIGTITLLGSFFDLVRRSTME
jgi:hypothetical protein